MTTSAKIYKTEAIVLKHVPLGEADYLLTLYSPTKGKIRAIARGARRVKSKVGGHLEPLMRTSFLIAAGRSLDAVSQAEVLEGFRLVREDLQRLTQALYMAELVDAITPDEEASYPVYRLLLDSLRYLAGDPPPSLMPYFQLHLLDYSGFRPELYRCTECGSTIEPSMHRFSPDRGGTLCLSCRPPEVAVLPLSLDALKVLRFLLKEDFARVERLHLERDNLVELERLMGTLIQHVLDREIRTSRFLHNLSQDRLEKRAGPAPGIDIKG
ncbi:MAG: DNA repair protein RecO [Chloroflexi bacterium]|nr:DNA repair protein RecO [Chloroflexota bacterium]